MLLESQYRQYLSENPGHYLTYDEWFSKWGEINGLPIVSDNFQIWPDGAYEATNEVLTIQYQKELIDLYEQQIMDLTIMYKIELGDDVIAEIKRLKTLINEYSR